MYYTGEQKVLDRLNTLKIRHLKKKFHIKVVHTEKNLIFCQEKRRLLNLSFFF